MDREAIIRMAREVGIEFDPGWGTCFTGNVQIERFAALVAKHERDQCALIAAHILKMPQNDVSAAIRARGNQ